MLYFQVLQTRVINHIFHATSCRSRFYQEAKTAPEASGTLFKLSKSSRIGRRSKTAICPYVVKEIPSSHLFTPFAAPGQQKGGLPPACRRLAPGRQATTPVQTAARDMVTPGFPPTGRKAGAQPLCRSLLENTFEQRAALATKGRHFPTVRKRGDEPALRRNPPK
jgi:hypothetical protein